MGDLARPSAEHPVGLRGEAGAVSLRLLAQIVHRDVGRSELDGMADIPFLELPRIGFEMELQRERVVAIGLFS